MKHDKIYHILELQQQKMMRTCVPFDLIVIIVLVSNTYHQIFQGRTPVVGFGWITFWCPIHFLLS